VLAQYETRLNEVQASMQQAHSLHGAAGAILIIAGVLFLVLGFYALGKQVPFWWPLVPVPFAAFALNDTGEMDRSHRGCGGSSSSTIVQ
jgi:hypothetical protein